MGVHGLWELLSTVGRRVSVETLAGKKLAIDASIWMIQFMKAMRDERGEMVRNAHILGFFRRICKLLFLRTKPVFVFDGGTPALKRRTVAARRRHREKARAKIRKTAEKLLLNHLKSKRLEGLADEIKRGNFGVKDDAKGKQVASVGDDIQGLGETSSSGRSRQGVDRAINQQSLDELLAVSIAAEVEGKLAVNAQVPCGNLNYAEEGEESDDEEMIFPVTSSNIDPAVLASLPPSMQLNLLDQMRERLMAENRQKYQKIKKVPAKFSELQIQSYLKTVAFRREINEVQKSAAGRGVGGLQTSRIASEANREYIFSSSFTGDKQMLTSSGVETNCVVNQETNMTAASNASKCKLFMSQLKSPSEMSSELVTREIGQDVETYLDERGRVRVSRVRGLGIHMTRDLQRNLDLMNEYEQVFVKRDLNKIPEPPRNNVSDFPKGYSRTNGTPSPSIVNEECNLCSSVSIAREKIYEDMNTEKSLSVSASGAVIEISFSEDENESKAMVDNFFMNLVFGNRKSELFSDSISLEKNVNQIKSECIWEDGEVGEQSLKLKDGNDKANQTSFVESKCCEEDEVEWEEGASLVSHCVETEKAVSRGLMEEEADLQEAIRRSLVDITVKRCSSRVPGEANTARTDGNQNVSISVKNDINIELPIERNQLQSHPADCIEEKECFCSHKAHQSTASQNEHHLSSIIPGGRSDGELTLEDDKNNSIVYSSDVVLAHDTQSMEQSRNKQESMCKIASNLMDSDPNLKTTDGLVIENYPIIDIETTGCKPDTDLSNVHDISVDFLSTNSLGTRSGISFSGARPSIAISQKSSIEKTVASIDGMQELLEDDTDPAEGLSFSGQNSLQEEDYVVISEANLDDEIYLLKQERANLGEEQRKLERAAESVSSEMFAECQELLQMFGLPYIIAPMEAEAQCACMEMSNLVDGIVTDDSDVFLFGARNVYKNIFDDRKYVETYFMKDIENELGLSREKLIHMALLLGSDYTEGVSGIGIVNAIEVVNTFPEEGGLLKFKEWVESPDPAILGLHGSHCGGNLNKKSSNTSVKTADGMENNAKCSGSDENFLRGAGDQSSNSTISDAKKVFMDKHRNVSKNWHFSPSFPSESVIAAYISPQIDESTEPFAWGKPDLPLLRKICWEKFGWPNLKADELLVPVLKEYNKHETQLRMEAFYSFNERFAKIRSQRIKTALKGITGSCSSELSDIGEDDLSSNRKRGISPFMNEQAQLSNDTYRSNARERKSSKLSRRTTRSKTPPPNESAEPSEQGSGSNKRGKVVNARTRGRARRSGRGRGRGEYKGKGSEHLIDEFTESSSDDERRNRSKMHKSIMTRESMLEMRSPVRYRKPVNYAEHNAEINELSSPIRTTDVAALEHEAVTKVMAFGNEGDNAHQEKMVLQDYLHSGGGFCLDENETQDKGQPSPASPMKHSFEQDHGKNRWLQDVNSSCPVSGGGFRMDESDPGLPASSRILQCELNEPNYHRNGQGSDFGTSGQYDSMKQYEGSAHEDLQVLEKGDSSLEQAMGNAAAHHPLSAMPSLKRKRKKG